MTDSSHLMSWLLGAVIEQLEACGNPVGLGDRMTGKYTQTWRVIVERLA